MQTYNDFFDDEPSEDALMELEDGDYRDEVSEDYDEMAPIGMVMSDDPVKLYLKEIF